MNLTMPRTVEELETIWNEVEPVIELPDESAFESPDKPLRLEAFEQAASAILLLGCVLMLLASSLGWLLSS